MQRRSFLVFLVLTAVISVAATVIVLSALDGQFQPKTVTVLVTFPVVYSPTPNPNATVPFIIITATPLPGTVPNLPSSLFETPDLSRTPLPTIDSTVIQPNSIAASTVTGLPPNCVAHVVEEGDSPSSIAAQYGVGLDNLMAVNGLDEESAKLLRIGDILIVPLEGCALQPAPTNTPAPATARPGKRTTTPEATPEVTSEFSPTPSPSPTITLAPTAANAQVTIVEVIGAGDITTEGVRIRNQGNTVNVTGWTLNDAQGNQYTFPEQLLFSNAEIIVFTRAGQNTPVAFYWGRDSAVWDSGDVVTLKDKDGKVQATLRVPSSQQLP